MRKFVIGIIAAGIVAGVAAYFIYEESDEDVISKPIDTQKSEQKTAPTTTTATQAKSIELSPEAKKKVWEYLIEGNTKAARGKHKEAITFYDMVLELDPNNAEAYYLRGKSKELLGATNKEQLAKAIEDYNKSIELDPKNSDTYMWRGNAKRMSGKVMDAVADYTTAINIYQNFTEAYYNRGFAKEKSGDYVGAIADWSYAISLKPSLKPQIQPYINKANAKMKREAAQKAKPRINPRYLKKK
ncbi:tetratricopeptide repeat protein [Candidatus Peregrinibacteria bacterium]|nr:tetratricopeptide repeat protein [Candidatus Peregrinibacteria bacterium]